MNLTWLRRFYIAVFLLLPLISIGQIDDVGLWLGASAGKQITRDAEIVLGEQIRFNHDVTTIGSILTDVGFEYSISNKLKTGIHYRFIASNQENYYSKRHRIYINVAYKEKLGIVTLTLRERIQEQYNDYNSSETGKIPVWVLRSKLTAKFDLDKKYTPYIAGEVYYLVDNAREVDEFFSRLRFELGIDYEFNRVNSINPFILYQHAMPVAFDQLVYGVMYNFSF